MPARLLDGTTIASEIKAEVAAEVEIMTAAGLRPGLAAVLIGNHSASEIYVRNKVRACEALGIYSERIYEPELLTTREVLNVVDDLNQRDEIDGVLVQLPLPPTVDFKRVLTSVDPLKDVDGFHPLNMGNLATNRPTLASCTPLGVMEILKRSGIEIAGKDAVVVGRSDIVGKPMAMLLTNANATVTLCHSKTRNLAEVCRRADIVVAAIGHPAMITRDFIKPGATVIDVGINRVSDRAIIHELFDSDPQRQADFAKKGYTIVGDVDPRVAEIAGAMTPVPGGVGLLTVAMLMVNTVKAAKMRRGHRYGIGR